MSDDRTIETSLIKSWWKSKAVVGIIAATVITIAKENGIEIPFMAEDVTNAVYLLGQFVAVIVAIYGRFKATHKLV